MAPNIPSKYLGIRLNLQIELAKQFQNYPHNRAGNHDYLGINKHHVRIERAALGSQPKTSGAPKPQHTLGSYQRPIE